MGPPNIGPTIPPTVSDDLYCEFPWISDLQYQLTHREDKTSAGRGITMIESVLEGLHT